MVYQNYIFYIYKKKKKDRVGSKIDLKITKFKQSKVIFPENYFFTTKKQNWIF